MMTLESRMTEIASSTIRQYTTKKNFDELMNKHSELSKDERLNLVIDDILNHIKNRFNEDSTLQKLQLNSEYQPSWYTTAHLHYTSQVLDRVTKAFGVYQKPTPITLTCPCTLV